MKLLCGIIALLNAYACHATITFTTPPFNTTAGVGASATIACIVTGKGSSDSVKWKRTGQTSTLTLDGTSVGGDRFQVVGTYNLTISNITKADEGGYTCEAGPQGSTQQRTAYLTVVEFPRNVSVYWSTLPIAGTLANLTCKATHANPTPSFAWYKDNIVYDHTAVYYTTPSSQGYVDAFSVLPVQLTVADQSSRFRCQLEYTGLSRAMEADIIITLSSGGIAQTGHFLAITLTTLLAFLIWQ